MHTTTGTTNVHVHNSYTDSPCKHADITDATHTHAKTGARNKHIHQRTKQIQETNANATPGKLIQKQTQTRTRKIKRNKHKTSRKINTETKTKPLAK